MRTAPPSLVPSTARLARVRCGLGVLATGVLLAAAPASSASAAGLQAVDASTATPARIAAAPTVSTVLPASAALAQRAGTSASEHWLIGASGDRTRLSALATAHGGTYNATLSILRVPTSQGDAVGRALGSAVTWAGPDVPAERASSLDQPGNIQSPWSRSVALAPSLTPAPGTLAKIGIVDDAVDRSVAELASTDVINGVGATEPHGTMVASTAAAPFDGVGVVGVAPGAPVLSWGTTLTCGDVANGITNLVKRGAQVVNLSLGFTQNCFALWQAVSYAYANNVTMVVASGNDGDRGNPLSFPASYPHVITAGAIDASLVSAAFSNYNDYVDIAAPGVDVPVDVPLRFDIDDGVRDGQTTVSGTSFSSPFVAGSVSWILGSRPGLDPSQVEGVLRTSSRDLDQPGWDAHTGYGLVQVAPAMAAVPPAPDLLEPNDYPAFVRASGIFKKKAIWTGGKKAVTLGATGDSADDNIDAYRVKVPAHGHLKATLVPTSGTVNLFAFDGSVNTFAGRPVDASTKPALAKDTIKLRNSSSRTRTAFIVVNSVAAAGLREQSSYSLTVKRG